MPDAPPEIAVQTFGCRLNIAESEAMHALARAAGLRDAVIVHSCAVTAEAERQSRQAVRRWHRERPDAAIIVAGCAATLRPEAFAHLPGVLRVLDNGEKLDPARWAPLGRPDAGRPLPAPTVRGPHTRGFVAVQQGCDHRCTFCVIPLARGPNRSMPAGQVVAETRRLAATGCREVVLTGVDLTGWGGDLAGTPRLGDLVRAVLRQVPELPRLRLSSLDPAEIDEALWQALAEEERLMPHLHLSVQAGDDLVLKQMRRRHGRTQVIEAASRARTLRPDMALGADLIAGFPTESDEAFARTLDLVDEAGLDYLHVFPYSPRIGTPAARLRPLPGPVVAERARRLRELAGHRLARRLDRLIGTTAAVLIERDGTGHAECFARVRPVRPEAAGALVRLRLARVEGNMLLGDAA